MSPSARSKRSSLKWLPEPAKLLQHSRACTEPIAWRRAEDRKDIPPAHHDSHQRIQDGGVEREGEEPVDRFPQQAVGLR